MSSRWLILTLVSMGAAAEQAGTVIKTRPLPADTFAIPKGFTQTTMAADTSE